MHMRKAFDSKLPGILVSHGRRLFLLDRSQTARSVIVVALAQRGMTDLAEKTLADYLAKDPKKFTERSRMEGEIAKAYIVLKPGATQDAEAILALCRDQLAAYKVPRAVQFVADLPKTSTGKIMRRELKTLDT